MTLLPIQENEASFLSFGREAVSLLEKRDFQSLADRFGYAVAADKSPRVAIEEDFRSCLAAFHASSEPRPSVPPSTVVKYFKPNSGNFFALIECVFTTPEGCPILVELIVSASGKDKHVFLEQISPLP